MQRVTSSSARLSKHKLPTDFESLVRLHPPYAIQDEVAYKNAQEVIDALTCVPDLSKGQMAYLRTLTVLFEAYENERHALDTSKLSPLDALKVMMEEHEMSSSDLGRLVGERSLGAKIMNGHRELSKTHIRKLAEHFHVTGDLFL